MDYDNSGNTNNRNRVLNKVLEPLQESLGEIHWNPPPLVLLVDQQQRRREPPPLLPIGSPFLQDFRKLREIRESRTPYERHPLIAFDTPFDESYDEPEVEPNAYLSEQEYKDIFEQVVASFYFSEN